MTQKLLFWCWLNGRWVVAFVLFELVGRQRATLRGHTRAAREWKRECEGRGKKGTFDKIQATSQATYKRDRKESVSLATVTILEKLKKKIPLTAILFPKGANRIYSKKRIFALNSIKKKNFLTQGFC